MLETMSDDWFLILALTAMIGFMVVLAFVSITDRDPQAD